MTTMDATALAQGICAAFNAHDVTAVVRLFTDDAVVHLVPPPPGEQEYYRGLAEIREWATGEMPGFHVDYFNLRSDGGTATFGARVVSDESRQLNVGPLEMTGKLVTRGEKVSQFTITLEPQTLAKLQAALEQMERQGQPR